MNYRKLTSKKKNGSEAFSHFGKSLEFNLSNFWSWSQSDLLGNTLRGILAEYIVAKDLGILDSIRIEWDTYDLKSLTGKKIEVKSSAYLQSWRQEKHSTIKFDIASKREWIDKTKSYAKISKRHAGYYVFSLLHHKIKKTVNPLILDQWTFYVLPTEVLNDNKNSHKTIGLDSLLKLNPTICRFGEIREVVL